MKRESKFPLEAFAKTLSRLREAQGVSQGELQKQTEEKLGKKGGVKIISLWETCMRKKPDSKKLEFVQALDEVLGAGGTLFSLYESPPLTIEDEMMTHLISATEECKRVLRIKVTKLLPDELVEHSKATDWIEGWTAFFIESRFEMTDEIKRSIQSSLTLLSK